MGRFESTVEFYRYREPYPPEFFETLAQRLQLSRDTRLLDVGCGPGLLAIGFAPFVGSSTGIDREPEMLREARRAAAEANADITFVETAIEDLPAGESSFELVTIGRAIHWLPREQTLAVFNTIVSPGGRIAVCGSRPSDSEINSWDKPYKELRKAWSVGPHESHYQVNLAEWFAPSRFRKLDEILLLHQQQVSVEELVKRMLSFSVVSPAVLGDKRAQFEAEVREVLEPFAKDGSVAEEVIVSAAIFG